MRIAVIGAGVAGLSCAAALADCEHQVVVFDKGRGVGGRMSVRRFDTPLGPVAADHGAQFFTARDADFAKALASGSLRGASAPWPAAGPEALVGVPGMNAPLKRLSQGLDLRLAAEVVRLAPSGGGWTITLAGGGTEALEAVALAVPAEQAARLLHGAAPDFEAAALATPTDPCLCAIAVLERPLTAAGDSHRGEGDVGYAARNTSKPGRAGPETVVIHGSTAFSRRWLEATPQAAARALWSAFADSLGGAPEPVALVGHRWRYARSGRLGEDCLWDRSLRLGVCGDWLLGPRVECGWLSGRNLAGKMSLDAD